MAWKLLERQRGQAGLRIGNFSVRSVNLHSKIISAEWLGRTGNWYIDRKLKVAKFILMKDGLYTVNKWMFCTPKRVQEFINDDQLVAYRSENGLYITSYKLGKSHLEKVLRREKALKNKR